MAALKDSEEIFSKLASKFTQLLQVRTEGDRDILERTLSELNSLDYGSPFVTNNTKAVLLINQCCWLIKPGEESLVTKYCQLITNLVHKQTVLIEGRTLTLLINWFFETLKTSSKNIFPELLCALQHVIQSNNKNLDILIPLIIYIESPILLLTDSKNSPEIILRAVQCLETCLTPSESRTSSVSFHNQFTLCANVFKRLLERDPPKLDEAMYCKISICCLKGFSHIILQDAEILIEEHGFLLGYIKTFMVYGIDGIEFLNPTKITPVLLSIPEPSTNIPREKKGGKVTRQRKHRTGNKNPVETKEWIDDEVPAQLNLGFSFQSDGNISGGNLSSKMKTSESDYSDSESARTAKLSILKGHLRQTALILFFNVIKCLDKKTMFSNWCSFIPENYVNGKHNLMTSILKDPSSKGRISALNVLLVLIDSAKFYLSQAEIREGTTSFTPFSEILGLTVKELHRCLFLALNENSVPVLIQVLKCLSALVQATPYARLGPGILTKVIRNAKVLLSHRDPRVQSAALIVFGCVLASDPVLPETRDALTRNSKSASKDNTEKITNDDKNQLKNNVEEIDYANFSSDEEDILTDTATDNQIPWILEKLLTNLGVKPNGEMISENSLSSPVKLESLQAMSAMGRNHFELLMVPHLQLIIKTVNLVLSDKNLDIRLHAGKLVDFLGQALNLYFSNEDSSHLLLIDQGVSFWQTILKEPLTTFLQNEKQEVLRTVGCDCIGSIGPHIFGRLPRSTQILCVTLLFACSRDEDIAVKAAAVRALAICVLYPTLREDHGFVVDTAMSVHALMQDKNLSVRIKASWGMGNLSDAIVLNSVDRKIEEELPVTLLLVLMHTCVEGCKDSDKVKMNAVRALGNLLQILTEKHFKHQVGGEFLKVVELGVSSIVQCATTNMNMKVRWNSCYALGNILKNECLFQFTFWQDSVFAALIELVQNFRNFKVRINAALALSCSTTRNMYKQNYHSIWKGLLQALEESQNAQDFTEYKHKDHLVEQICLSLAHLVTLLTKEDLGQLEHILMVHNEAFSVHLKKVYDRLIPEKSTILFDASTYLECLGKNQDLTSDQKNSLTILHSIFAHS